MYEICLKKCVYVDLCVNKNKKKLKKYLLKWLSHKEKS